MMQRWIGAWAVALVLLAPAAMAEETAADETYALLFKEGTLDGMPAGDSLSYARTVTNSLKPETEARDTGEIELALAGGEPKEARLRFIQGQKHKTLGTFPASVGNPIIMYFMETVARDMAETAGGSPFYIRNRLKAALVEPAEIETGEVSVDGTPVAAQTVTLKPFEDDPNADRMQGFDALELQVTMSEGAEGWYHTLVATVPGTGGDPVYSSVLTLHGAE